MKLHPCCSSPSSSVTDRLWSRREFVSRLGSGIGMIGLAALCAESATGGVGGVGASPLSPKQPHFPAKAKRVIHIFAQGAPSHVDTFDPKPELTRINGQPMPGDARLAYGSPFKFNKHGQCGMEVSEVFPELAKHVDEMTLIRSMHTDIPSHEDATLLMATGTTRQVLPSMGSWITYGLGSENQNLPGYIALGRGGVINGTQNWRSAFLPGIHQGTYVNTKETDVEKLIANIRSHGAAPSDQRAQLDLLQKLNARFSREQTQHPDLDARIQSFELAFQMQMEATDAFDISKEPQTVRDAYAADTPQGRQLLIARRLAERGVRVVQVWHDGWDHHTDIVNNNRRSCGEIDKPLAALIADLKQRGMLDETLVIWGGEFGRTPAVQPVATGNPGRDHHHHGFSTLLAGGGVKRGFIYGATDELGLRAVEDKVHTHDFHATILALLGFDHERLTYRYSGRDFRLTDVHGTVAKGVIA